MSSKKKFKGSCPFASSNRADVLATIGGRTIPFIANLAQTEGKDKEPAEPDSQESCQKLAARTIS